MPKVWEVKAHDTNAYEPRTLYVENGGDLVLEVMDTKYPGSTVRRRVLSRVTLHITQTPCGGVEVDVREEQPLATRTDDRTDETHTARIAEALRTRGFDAEAIHTGGGIWCVEVRNRNGNGSVEVWGTADVYWSGDFYATTADYHSQETNEPQGALESDCLSDEQDPGKVAEAIASAAGPSEGMDAAR